MDSQNQLIKFVAGKVVSNDGGSLREAYVVVDGKATVVSNDGGSLISQDGNGFQISAALASISQDGQRPD